jgi:hypothetical protein
MTIKFTLTEKETQKRLKMCAIVEEVANGKTFSMTARKFHVDSTLVIENTTRFVEMLRAEDRWGRFEEVISVLNKPLRLVCALHFELLSDACTLMRAEVEANDTSVWSKTPSNLTASPRQKNQMPPTPVWTPEMDARIGKDTDIQIAKELGTIHSHVISRRKKLGIPSYRKASTSGSLGRGGDYDNSKRQDDEEQREFDRVKAEAISQNERTIQRAREYKNEIWNMWHTQLLMASSARSR